MNKLLKRILITINSIMLILAILWYVDKDDWEPIIVIFGQTGSILVLIFEKGVTRIFTKSIIDSDIDISKNIGDDIHTEGVSNSKIKIR